MHFIKTRDEKNINAFTEKNECVHEVIYGPSPRGCPGAHPYLNPALQINQIS